MVEPLIIPFLLKLGAKIGEIPQLAIYQASYILKITLLKRKLK